MLKFIVAALCGISISGSVYQAGWGDCCISKGSHELAQAKHPAALKSLPAGVVDVKNTMCVVMGDKLGAGFLAVEYKGKAYQICCEECVAGFYSEPEKYVKALEADPAKFGLAKAGTPAVTEEHKH